MNRRIILLTWVSASWKTTLQERLIKNWWNKPINFTTRKPRDENAILSVDSDWDFTSKELNEYVFLNNKTFIDKYKNWDFLEITCYLWNRYWVSRHLPEWNICIILDPIWRSQALEYFTRVWIDVETYYLEISKDEQEKRLLNRWDTEKQILMRKRDFNWFSPTNKCSRLNWTKSVDDLWNFIINSWK